MAQALQCPLFRRFGSLFQICFGSALQRRLSRRSACSQICFGSSASAPPPCSRAVCYQICFGLALQHPSSLKNLFPLWRLSAPLPQNSQALNLFSSFPLKFVSAQRFSTHFSPNSQASNPFSSFPLKFALAQRFSTPSAEVSLSWALSPNSLSSLISLSSLSSQPSCSLATILVPLRRFCTPKRAQRTSCSSALVAF